MSIGREGGPREGGFEDMAAMTAEAKAESAKAAEKGKFDADAWMGDSEKENKPLEAGDLAAGNREEIPTSAESEAIRAEEAEARAERNAEEVAALKAEAKKEAA